MKHVPLRSSLVRSAGYDDATAVMEVRLASGAVYSFFAVPARVFSELVSAESAGEYFNAKVKGVFPFRKAE